MTWKNTDTPSGSGRNRADQRRLACSLGPVVLIAGTLLMAAFSLTGCASYQIHPSMSEADDFNSLELIRNRAYDDMSTDDRIVCVRYFMGARWPWFSGSRARGTYWYYADDPLARPDADFVHWIGSIAWMALGYIDSIPLISFPCAYIGGTPEWRIKREAIREILAQNQDMDSIVPMTCSMYRRLDLPLYCEECATVKTLSKTRQAYRLFPGFAPETDRPRELP